MKISFQNLGPIKNAEIDLDKRLTIFSGPNNSGKTYVAFLVYALLKASYKFYRETRDSSSLLLELLKQQSVDYKINVDEVWDYRNLEIENIKEGLDSVYGISSTVADDLFSSFSLQIMQTKKQFAQSIDEMNFENHIDINDFKITITKQKGDDFIKLKSNDSIVSKQDIELTGFFLKSKLLSLIGFYPFTTSHILPVERNSIYTFSKELSIQKQEFFDRAAELNSNKKTNPFQWLMKRSTRYPLPIRDGLEIAEDLDNNTKTKGDFHDLAEELEMDLLNGKMILSKDGEVQFSSNKAKSKKIPIHLSASIVKICNHPKNLSCFE